ncbi:hypothetical protein TNCV_322261 [Trichonephila clavipes]|nr:hypothetical protein TNCV_322261 [Trichonephila clavipes]
MMIPAYNKKRCAAFPFETGIHFNRKTDFFPEEDTTMSYSGFEPETTQLQAEGHSHHTGWAYDEIILWITLNILSYLLIYRTLFENRVFVITTRSRLADLTSTLHGISDILEDSWHVTYPPGSYRYSSDEVFN